jgi:TolB-like protein/DNA-binding winged helix-turn-helix (wHTH) protein/Flp pilus assembly protein TadD
MVTGPSSFRFGVFDVDVRTAELRRQGARVGLQEQPFQVLLQLLQHPGELVTRDELRQRLWPADTFVDFEQSLNAAISRLRHALDDSAESPRFIETVPRHGYRFIAKVETPPPSETQRRPWLRAPTLWVGGSLVLGFAVALAFGRQIRARVWPMEDRPRITAIAVLPLSNLSGDPTQEYLADGLTDALITELARSMPLKVVSRTSAMAYKGQRKPLTLVARELGVDGVVEGALLRAGRRVRITVQLVAAANDRHVWAESFDHDASDVFGLQEDVARAVAREVGVQVAAPMASRHRVEPEAMRLYVEGRYFYSRLSLDQAVERLNQAVTRDSSFAAAQGSLAMVEVDLSFFRPPGETLEKSAQAALRALAIEDGSAAHAALAGVRMFRDWDWPGAERDFRRAIVLDPSSSEVRVLYSNLLTAVGRSDEALAEAVRARERDPVSILANLNVGWTLTKGRRYEAALFELRRTLELDPSFALTHQQLAWCYTHQGRFAEAFAEFDHFGRDPRDPLLGFLYGASGQRSEALAVARELVRRSKTRYVSPYLIALPYLGAGDHEEAFHWLDRAFQERSSNLFLLKADPWWDGIRADPRFQTYLRRMGLEP